MRTISFAALALALAACDGTDISDQGHLACEDGTVIDGTCVPTTLECGEGTFELDGECVGYDPSDNAAPTASATPPGGFYRELPGMVVISANEPSIIYYTTDGFEPTTDSESAVGSAFITGLESGDELRYFAVDLSGNDSEKMSDTYILDTVGPDPVENLLAERTDTDVDVTWNNPDDIAGVLLARGLRGARPRSAPAPGIVYDSGDVLAGGEEVVVVGDVESANDVLSTPGFIIYGAWAFDAAGNYSEARYSNPVGATALPAQIGTLSVDLGTETVTVTGQPDHLTLSATAVYSDGEDSLRVTLTVQNDTDRILNNLKAVLDTVNQGTGVGEMFGGNVFWYYGARGLAPGQSRSVTIELSGITGGTDPIVATLGFLDHPLLLSRDDVIDASGSQPSATDTEISGRESAIAVDPLSRFAVYGARGRSTLQILDLTSHAVSSIGLFDGLGHVGGVAVSDQAIYVAASRGGHRNGGNGNEGGAFSTDAMDVWLFVFDPETLEQKAAVELFAPSSDLPCPSEIALSPDGSLLAVPVTTLDSLENELVLIDTDSLTPIDTDSTTAGVQNVPLSGNFIVESLAWQSGGQRVFVGFGNQLPSGNLNGDGLSIPDIDVVDTATYEVTQLVPTDGARAAGRMAFHAGKLYYANGTSAGRLNIFDFAGESEAVLDPGDLGLAQIRSVVVDPGGQRYYVSGSGDFCGGAIVNVSNDTPRTETFDALCPNRHTFTITPF